MNVIYCRYSPRPEHASDRAVSLPVQIKAGMKYAELNNLTIDKVIRDPDVSARTPVFERPGGSKLLSLPAESNVIAMKLDRVFRDTVDGLTTLNFWKENSVRFHLANEGGCSIDTSTAIGKMVATFLLGVASWEPEAIAERTKAALNHRLANGKAHLNPSNFPYGMQEDLESKKHALSGHHEGMTDCEEEQEIINTIINLRDRGYGLAETGRFLTNKGILCRGKKWHPQKIKRILKRLEN